MLVSEKSRNVIKSYWLHLTNISLRRNFLNFQRKLNKLQRIFFVPLNWMFVWKYWDIMFWTYLLWYALVRRKLYQKNSRVLTEFSTRHVLRAWTRDYFLDIGIMRRFSIAFCRVLKENQCKLLDFLKFLKISNFFIIWFIPCNSVNVSTLSSNIALLYSDWSARHSRFTY